MSEIIEILSGIYSRIDNPVIVFKMSGEVLWKNLSSKKADADIDYLKLFGEIIKNGNESGKINYLNGGRYYRSEILEHEMYIAELNNESKLLSLFSEPEIEAFSQYSEMQVRQAVTGITASCEIINELTEKSDSEEAGLCLNGIISSCCQLLKNTTIISQLVAIAKDNNLETVIINIDFFLESLTENCKKILGKNYSIKNKSISGALIEADKTLLTYFILGLIRNLICNVDSEKNEIIIDSILNQNSVTLKFELIKSDGISLNPENDVFDDILLIFANKLNAVYSVSDNCLSITFKCAENNGELVFNSNKTSFNDTFYTPAGIMLGDLSNFRAFY